MPANATARKRKKSTKVRPLIIVGMVGYIFTLIFILINDLGQASSIAIANDFNSLSALSSLVSMQTISRYGALITSVMIGVGGVGCLLISKKMVLAPVRGAAMVLTTIYVFVDLLFFTSMENTYAEQNAAGTLSAEDYASKLTSLNTVNLIVFFIIAFIFYFACIADQFPGHRSSFVIAIPVTLALVLIDLILLPSISDFFGTYTTYMVNILECFCHALMFCLYCFMGAIACRRALVR